MVQWHMEPVYNRNSPDASAIWGIFALYRCPIFNRLAKLRPKPARGVRHGQHRRMQIFKVLVPACAGTGFRLQSVWIVTAAVMPHRNASRGAEPVRSMRTS